MLHCVRSVISLPAVETSIRVCLYGFIEIVTFFFLPGSSSAASSASPFFWIALRDVGLNQSELSDLRRDWIPPCPADFAGELRQLDFCQHHDEFLSFSLSFSLSLTFLPSFCCIFDRIFVSVLTVSVKLSVPICLPWQMVVYLYLTWRPCIERNSLTVFPSPSPFSLLPTFSLPKFHRVEADLQFGPSANCISSSKDGAAERAFDFTSIAKFLALKNSNAPLN